MDLEQVTRYSPVQPVTSTRALSRAVDALLASSSGLYVTEIRPVIAKLIQALKTNDPAIDSRLSINLLPNSGVKA
jgi:hypothetical protein